MLLFITTANVKSQDLIPNSKVTVEYLSKLFTDAYYNINEKGDAYFVIKDGFPYYIDLDPTQRYVTMSIVFSLDDKFSKAEVYSLINKINKEIALIKCYSYDDSNKIAMYYYFWTEGGFTAKSLISSYKLFALAIDLALKKDTAKIIK